MDYRDTPLTAHRGVNVGRRSGVNFARRLTAVRAVRDRLVRDEQKRQAEAEANLPLIERIRLNQQRAIEQARKLYPPPETVRDPLIKELLTRLLAGETQDQLTELAAKIARDERGQNEMYRYGPNLAGLIIRLSEDAPPSRVKQPRKQHRLHGYVA